MTDEKDFTPQEAKKVGEDLGVEKKPMNFGAGENKVMVKKWILLF